MTVETVRADFYVATNGSDAWSGRLSTPNVDGSDGPFATLHRARDAVRQSRDQKEGAITVLVRGGTYYLKETLVLDPEDSGTRGQPITYAAYPGEVPTLSGGSQIRCEWTPYRDGIVQCFLPEVVAGQLDFDQLFVDGVRQVRARYPNGDSLRPDTDATLQAVGADTWPHREVYFDPQTFTNKTWAHPEDAVLHIFPGNYWGNMQYRICGLDQERSTLLLGEGGWQLRRSAASTGIDHRSRFFVENVFEELDAPGEWYLDKREGVLYYYPAEGVDLSIACIEVPMIAQVIAFQGTKENPVGHIQLQGFRFAHTAATYLEPYEVPSLGDWAIHRGGAVTLEGVEDCAVEACFFDAVGGNAVFVSNYAKRVRVTGNLFVETGESAVCLVGKSHLRWDVSYTCPYCGWVSDWGWGEPSDEIPSECVVHNNLIHDIGVYGKQTAGVFLSIAAQNTISHNHIYNTPRAAICINDGFYGGHVVEYNDVHDTVRETGDHGPFNSWGRERFWCYAQSHGPESHPAGDVMADARHTTVIRYNRFYDRKGWGIDLDDGTSNYHVHHNLCVGISVKLREGDYRTIENNVFVNGANPPGFHIGYEGNHDRFRRNIIVASSAFDLPELDIDYHKGRSGGRVYEVIGPPRVGPWFKEWDHNLFCSDVGEFRAAAHYIREKPRRSEEITLEQWQAMGYDRHSVYGDPLFVDPENGDYCVQPGSPALKLGFEDFDVSQAGLLPDFRHWLE